MNTYAQPSVAVITFILSACLAYENPNACRFGGFRCVLPELLPALLEETFLAFLTLTHLKLAAHAQQLPKLAALSKIILMREVGPSSFPQRAQAEDSWGFAQPFPVIASF